MDALVVSLAKAMKNVVAWVRRLGLRGIKGFKPEVGGVEGAALAGRHLGLYTKFNRSFQMRFDYVVAGAWAILLAGGALGSQHTLFDKLFAFVILSPLWLGPIWLVHRNAVKSQRKLNTYVAKFLGALGHTDEKLYHLSKTTGSIGLNPAAKQLVLGDGDLVKAYSFGDVRGWATETKSAGSVVGVSVLAAVAQAGAHNQARLQSGLVVRVRDTEKAEWLITMDGPGRSRWFELLTQAINEGGLQSV